MVAVRKYVLYGRAFLVCQSLPWVSSGAVLEGEISTRLAVAKTCCIWVATPELRGPTTPRTSSSATSAVAFCWPVAGMALSSRAFTLKVTPGTVLFLLASSTAICTPYWMPRPVAEFWPVSGASTPMTTVVPPLSSLPPLSSREPQAVRVSAPAARAAVMAMSERGRTIVSPFTGTAVSPWKQPSRTAAGCGFSAAR